MVDVAIAGRRVLDQLLYLSDPETGTAEISQNEMCAELGASKPTVNRGFKELRECGLAWGLEDGRYQLHPLLTGGAVSSPVMPIPEIKAAEPERFTERRRARYAAQMVNLAPTG
ncbi:helix-turn-helix domain-containing protein [Streptomyces sp. NPDC004129]